MVRVMLTLHYNKSIRGRDTDGQISKANRVSETEWEFQSKLHGDKKFVISRNQCSYDDAITWVLQHLGQVEV